MQEISNIPNIYTSLEPSYCKKCSNLKKGILIFHQRFGDCIKSDKYKFCPKCGYSLK